MRQNETTNKKDKDVLAGSCKFILTYYFKIVKIKQITGGLLYFFYGGVFMAMKGGMPQNLKPVANKEEARLRGIKGGKASGEARRKKKQMKEYAEIILSSILADKSLEKEFKDLGVKSVLKKGYTLYEAMIIGQVSSAIKGNTQAYNALKETVEPKTDFVDNNVEDLTPLADMLADNDDEDDDE